MRRSLYNRYINGGGIDGEEESEREINLKLQQQSSPNSYKQGWMNANDGQGNFIAGMNVGNKNIGANAFGITPWNPQTRQHWKGAVGAGVNANINPRTNINLGLEQTMGREFNPTFKAGITRKFKAGGSYRGYEEGGDTEAERRRAYYAARESRGQQASAYEKESARVEQVKGNVPENAERIAGLNEQALTPRLRNWFKSETEAADRGDTRVDSRGNTYSVSKPYSCNTYSCQLLRDSGATVASDFDFQGKHYEEGDPLPVIPGNSQFNSNYEALGFSLKPKGALPDQVGDLIRGHYGETGQADSGGQHSLVTTGEGVDEEGMLTIHNSPGSYDRYNKVTPYRESWADPIRYSDDLSDNRVMEYVGTKPKLRKGFEDASQAIGEGNEEFGLKQMAQRQMPSSALPTSTRSAPAAVAPGPYAGLSDKETLKRLRQERRGKGNTLASRMRGGALPKKKDYKKLEGGGGLGLQDAASVGLPVAQGIGGAVGGIGGAGISGAAKGASMGAFAGPWGMAAGAVLGGAVGMIGAAAHKKQAEIDNIADLKDIQENSAKQHLSASSSALISYDTKGVKDNIDFFGKTGGNLPFSNSHPELGKAQGGQTKRLSSDAHYIKGNNPNIDDEVKFPESGIALDDKEVLKDGFVHSKDFGYATEVAKLEEERGQLQKKGDLKSRSRIREIDTLVSSYAKKQETNKMNQGMPNDLDGSSGTTMRAKKGGHLGCGCKKCGSGKKCGGGIHSKLKRLV